MEENKEKLVVNDIHSQLNETTVSEIHFPTSLNEISFLVKKVRDQNLAVSICGGRHAMGSQQFAKNSILIDTTRLNKVLSFDTELGLIEVEAGIKWPELVAAIRHSNSRTVKQWSIIQKQTGADNLTLGGSLSANIHGRGLKFKPIIDDVESFILINSAGENIKCSRTENYQLFTLAIGGYGLFGVIATVTLRLTPAQKLVRIVKLVSIDNLLPSFNARIEEGFLFGDFQFNTNSSSPDFLTKGVFSCYGPAPANAVEASSHLELSPEKWQELYRLGHVDRKKAFEVYSSYYLSTSGQIYDSDLHQMSYYLENYHQAIDKTMGVETKSSEMITEIYVPRENIVAFMSGAAEYLKTNGVMVFYGTIRLIEKDEESFLAWAKKPYICIIFNLHVIHDAEDIKKAKKTFTHLIDMAISLKGSYYLTYHPWASKAQIEKCYPQFREFLVLKKKYDPEEVFQSEWYRQLKQLFS